MREVSCRLATEDDFPILLEMYSQLNAHFYQVGYRLPRPENVGVLWLDSFKRTLGRFSNLLVAETGGEVVGFLLCRLKRLPAHMGGVLVGEISDIWIEASARRMGVGEKLSRCAIDWMREQDVHSIEVQILKDNQASLRLYESLGFKLEFSTVRLLWDEYIEG